METFRTDGDADVDSLNWALSWFIAESVWVKLGSEPAVDVEFYADYVGGFGFSRLGQFKALMD